MFLTQKVQNVLTSGFYLDRVSNGVVEKAVSSIMDLLLLPSWKQLYLQVGNHIMFMLFTEYSIFYQLSPNHIIQLAGPYLSVVSREKEYYPPISLSVIYFHLSFSKYPGFVKNHIFSQLIQLNQAINRIETNSPSSAFAYKSIRKDVVMLLVHQVFKDCYSKWKNISFEEELKNLKIRYHLQVGVWNRKRIPFPPRLESCKQELAKLLYNCSRCCFSDSLEKTAPLPKEYVEYRNQWKYTYCNGLRIDCIRSNPHFHSPTSRRSFTVQRFRILLNSHLLHSILLNVLWRESKYFSFFTAVVSVFFPKAC